MHSCILEEWRTGTENTTRQPSSHDFLSKSETEAEREDNAKKGDCLLTKPVHSAILKEWTKQVHEPRQLNNLQSSG